MNKTLYTTLILLLFSLKGFAQCECTDCAVTIPNNGTASSFLDISGATNNTLGQSGQSLCQLCIELVYDAIQELDMVLIAPSGDAIDLMINTGIAVNDDITFNICFTPCSESADPDPGFPAVFDTDAGYLPNETYDGTYYPASGCFEDLGGSVNGTWELEMTDNVFADNGDLLDWYLVFTDDSGIGCANAGDCELTVSCLADGGFLSGSAFITECEGDSNLDLDLPPTYGGGGGPPAADYEYTYVIADATSDIVLDITMDTDLTTFAPGAYQICGLSYLIDDESLLPSADGSLEVSDIEDQIDDEDYCADLSSGCTIVVIEELVTPPTVVGPTTVCAGETVTWEITDYDPSLNYLISISSGSFSFFTFIDNIVTVEFLSGPGDICFIINSACGDEETCLIIDVLPNQPEYEVIGATEACPGETVIYTIDPSPATGTEYIYSVTGGTIIDETDNTVTVEWPNAEGSGELCVELDGTACDIDPLCVDVDIEFDYELPNDLDSPDELCTGTTGSSSIPSSSDILSYTWTSTNLDITGGLNTNSVEYEGISAGVATICLEIETACGFQGPLCDNIDIFEAPEPEILEVDPTCEFSVILEAITGIDTELEWFLVSGPGTVDFDPVDENITTADFSQAGFYEIAIEESNDACEATTTIEIEILDELQIEEGEILCDGDYNYTVAFEITSGQAPYTVNGDEIASSDFISDPIPSGDDYEFLIVDALGCLTVLEGEFECPCITDAGSMEDELLTSCITEDDIIVAEWNDDATLDNNDVVLFYLHDGDDDELGNIIDFNTTGEFEYSDELVPGETYYISAVAGNPDGDEIDLDDDCLSVAEGQPIIFFDTPEIDLFFDQETCIDELIIDGDFDPDVLSIQWTLVDGPDAVEFSDDESIPLTINFTTIGDYSFEYELRNDACVLFEEIDISYTGAPFISDLIEDCNGSSEFYQIQFTINGGIPPYQVNIPGTINGNTFVSDQISSGSAYSVIITDDDGCTSTEFVGQKLCDCNTNAGVFENITIEVCGLDAVIQIDTANNSFIEDNDIITFFLHENNVFQQSEIIDSSLTGIFTFDDAILNESQVYYVSMAVGNAINDSLDFNDPCLDISNSIPVVWYAFPIADAGPDQFSCDDNVILGASGVLGQWLIIDSPANSVPELSDNSSPQSVLSFDLVGNYTLEWTLEENNCISRDTVVIEKLALPEIESVSISCNDDLVSYNIELSFSSNTPYLIDGNTYLDNFSLTNVPSSDSLFLSVENSLGCSIDLVYEPIDCSCPSSIGTVDFQSLELCQSESLTLDALFNTDFTLADEDTLLYVIHDGDQFNIGNIIQQVSNILDFDPNIYNQNQTYFVSMLITPVENGEPLLDDACSQYSESISILWLSNTEIRFDNEAANCIGQGVEIQFDVTGILPVTLVFENQSGESVSIQLDNASDLIAFDIDETETIWTLTETVGTCITDTDLEIRLEGIAGQEAEFVSEATVCNNSLFGSTILLNDLLVDNTLEGEWNTGVIADDDGIIDLDGFDAGTYELEFSTIGFQDPCPGNVYTLSITVEECICPQLQFNDIATCNASDNINLGQFNTQGFEGEWRVENSNNLTTAPQIAGGTEISVANATGGTYQIIYTVTDALFPMECDAEFSFELNIEEQSFAGSAGDMLTFCEDEIGAINLFEQIDDEDTGGDWIGSIPVNNGIVNIEDLLPGLNSFEYSIAATSLCAASSVLVEIELVEVPEFELVTEDVLCFGDDNGTIEITITDSSGTDITCYLNDIEQDGSKLIEGLSPGEYSIYVSNEFCASETETVSIGEPDPITVNLGEDRQVSVDEEITMIALTNLLDSDIESVSWSDLSEIIGLDVLQLRESFQNNTTIIVEITDNNGCIGIDELLISINQEDIYIPNIFNPGDPSNNRFGILNEEAVELISSYLIFDRWGNNVFERNNISPTDEGAFWDGFYNDTPAVQGVYVYVIDVLMRTGERRIISGDITLVR